MSGRRALVLAVAVLGASALALRGAPPVTDAPLEATSIRGDLAAPPGWTLVDARLRVAHVDTPAADGSTPLARDHWVLELELAAHGETPARAHLVWNDAPRGAVDARPTGGTAFLRFDVGSGLERVSVYRLTLVNK